MRFSLITATYNSAQTLDRCLTSVSAQHHRDLEHLIVDGGSSDGTIEILAKHRRTGRLKVVCSEADHGIYEAWNKALNFISGDWVLFLGSDDWLASPNSLAMASAAIIQHPEVVYCEFVCGKTLGIRGQSIGLTPDKWAWRESDHWWNHWRGSLPLPAQPGVLHRASLFRSGVRFDESYRICADQKLLWENGFHASHCWIDVALSNHQPGGISQNKATAALHRHERRRMLSELGRPRPDWIEPLLTLKDYLKQLKN